MARSSIAEEALANPGLQGRLRWAFHPALDLSCNLSRDASRNLSSMLPPMPSFRSCRERLCVCALLDLAPPSVGGMG